MPATNKSARNLPAAIASLPHNVNDIRRSAGVAGGRKIIVVLGMHRSGTSLLSNVLHYLGVDMADQSDHASSSNPSGFWERPSLVAVQDDILADIGRAIDGPSHCLPFPPGWWRGKGVQAQKRRLRAIVSDHLSQCPGPWGFKDPRTCRLLPLWWEIFSELELEPQYLWAVRRPGESSASMARKNPVLRPMAPALAEVTWLAYNYDILRYTSAANRTTIVYDDWFTAPVEQADRLRVTFDLPGLESATELAACVTGIVDESFRHQREGLGNAVARLAVAQQLFAEISTAQPGNDVSQLGGYLAVIDVVFAALSPFVELLSEIPTLRRDLRVAKKQLANILAASDVQPGPQAAGRVT